MYQRIMVPINGTRFSEQALPYAISIAKRSNCGIDLAIVEALPRDAAPDVFAYMEPIRASDANYLDALAPRVRDAGVADVTCSVLEGRPAEALEAHRAQIGADLTVMSTHGRGPIARAWLGSVTDEFARLTSAPVMMVRPVEDTGDIDLAVSHDFDEILVPVDGSQKSEEAIGPAVDFAQMYGATTTFLHLVEYPHGSESVYIPDAAEANREKLEAHRAKAEEELQRLTDQFRDKGSPVETDSRVVMHVAEGILETAEQRGVDVIAMASHGRGGLRRMVLGSVTDKVMRGSQRPVLIITSGG